jgi:hypothetical protein
VDLTIMNRHVRDTNVKSKTPQAILNYQLCFGHGTISHTIAGVGLGSQLDRASSLALAQDMRTAAQEVAAQLTQQS